MSLVKSKQRVADHGEVFTPTWLVEAMLDLVKEESERIDSRCLEPACGSGNFLVLRVRTNRDATPVNDPDWLQINFNYQMVPVPAAVWLFGSALGLMGIARRRSIAAQA